MSFQICMFTPCPTCEHLWAQLFIHLHQCLWCVPTPDLCRGTLALLFSWLFREPPPNNPRHIAQPDGTAAWSIAPSPGAGVAVPVNICSPTKFRQLCRDADAQKQSSPSPECHVVAVNSKQHRHLLEALQYPTSWPAIRAICVSMQRGVQWLFGWPEILVSKCHDFSKANRILLVLLEKSYKTSLSKSSKAKSLYLVDLGKHFCDLAMYVCKTAESPKQAELLYVFMYMYVRVCTYT